MLLNGFAPSRVDTGYVLSNCHRLAEFSE